MASSPEGIVEAVGASVATKGLWAGGAAGLVGWLSQVNWIGITGVVPVSYTHLTLPTKA